MNELKKMVENFGLNSSLQVYEKLFVNGNAKIIAQGTFYRAISGEEIPSGTDWDTVKKIAEVLGYRVEFVKNDQTI